MERRKRVQVKLDKPISGEPKWDWMLSFRMPLNFKNWKLGNPHVGKGFLKRMLKKLKIEL
jgi:hypothetical protein